MFDIIEVIRAQAREAGKKDVLLREEGRKNPKIRGHLYTLLDDLARVGVLDRWKIPVYQYIDNNRFHIVLKFKLVNDPTDYVIEVEWSLF